MWLLEGGAKWTTGTTWLSLWAEEWEKPRVDVVLAWMGLWCCGKERREGVCVLPWRSKQIYGRNRSGEV